MAWNKLDKFVTADCDVIELKEDFYVYPIFKNASSSMYKEQQEKDLRIYKNRGINKLKLIHVYLRDPHQRLTSGIRTYLEKNPNTDALDQISNNQLLDRHFMPQYFWLLHLLKYYKGDVVLRPFKKLTSLLTYNINSSVGLDTLPNLKNIEKLTKIDTVLIKKFMNRKVNLKNLIRDLYGLSKA